MKNLTKLLVKKIFALTLFPLKYFVSKGNVVIMQTYNNYIYCENTKYLYEYLSSETDLNVYWVTENKDIQIYLDSKDYKYMKLKCRPRRKDRIGN